MSRVVVAMSGGVDSSVAAALMQKEGHEVIGITMTLTPNDGSSAHKGRGCCSVWDVTDAEKVAWKLNIPHYVFNLREEFQKKVISDFVSEYRKGRTPNPCRRCNQYIKFDSLLERVEALDAEAVVTGHYAQIRDKDGRYRLFRGKDLAKDQSYVLASLTQKQLAKVRFPLGGYSKPEIRKIAAELDLIVATKKESMDLCFIPDGDTAGFLTKHLGDRTPGPIVDTSGKKLGDHPGLGVYTIGQRKGLGLATGAPKYVVEQDVESNTLVIGSADELDKSGIRVDELNWISQELPQVCQVQYRSTHRGCPARIEGKILDEEIAVYFDEPQKALNAGQAAVFYEGDEVLGGGTIYASF